MFDGPIALSSSRLDGETHRRALSVACILAEEAEAADQQGSPTTRALDALVGSGLLMAPLPADLQGDDLGAGDNRALLAILRLFGAADLSMGRLYEGHVNAILLVRRFGTRAQLEDLAHAITRGALSGVWAADGAEPMRASALGGGGWRLEGRKILASGAGLVTRPLVPVSMDGGHLMVMPDLSGSQRADASGWTAQGMRSSATGAVDFTGLVVEPRRVIGERGDFMRQPWFSGGAWRFCAVHLGAVERLVDLLREHLVAHKRGGDAYQLQRIAQATTVATTAALWIERAADRLAERAEDAPRTVAFANLTRGVTEQAALDVLELVHRGVGLGAFMRPHPIERISRDLATYLRQPAPDRAMMDAARTVLASPIGTAALWDLPPRGSAHPNSTRPL